MKNLAKTLKVTGAALALGLSASLATAGEKWDMPLAYSATNYHSENAAKFAEEITKASGGELEVVTHPSGSLFKGGEIFRAIRTGQAPIGERLISALGNEDAIFEIDALPFLASSFAEAKNLYKASKPAMQKVLAEKGVKLLYAVPWPPQGLYANKPINSAADMKGLKFRAYNAATSRLAELMGAVPTKIEAAELSQAFATGVAESMISSGSTGYDRKIWEHVKYWYERPGLVAQEHGDRERQGLGRSQRQAQGHRPQSRHRRGKGRLGKGRGTVRLVCSGTCQERHGSWPRRRPALW